MYNRARYKYEKKDFYLEMLNKKTFTKTDLQKIKLYHKYWIESI